MKTSALRSSRRIFLAVALVFATLNAGAENAETKDYSRDVAMFYRLGLPRIGDAEYVALTLSERDFNDDTCPEMSNRYWKLDKQKDSGRFLANETTPLDVAGMSVYRQDLLAERRNGLKRNGKKLYGTWKAAPLKKDVEALLERLNRLDGEKLEIDDETPRFGRYFLFAIHIREKGLVKEADAIMNKLFALAGDSRKVTLSALNYLADRRYDDAYRQFQNDRDWKKFKVALENLLATYPNDWRTAPGVKILVDKIDAVLNGAVPEITGSDLSDTDRRLARKLVAAEGRKGDGVTGYPSYDELWLFEAIDDNAASDTGVVREIERRGPDSVPLLTALLQDNALTGLDFHLNKTNLHSDDQRDANAPETLFETMERRPATRGEIAKKLLKQILVSPKNKLTPANFANAVADWREATKGKNLRHLAEWYLDAGDKTQKRSALAYLAKRASDDEAAKIEASLLDVDSDIPDGAIVNYIRTRGDKARPFAKKYLAALKKEAANEKRAPDEIIYGSDSELTAVETFLSGETAETFLDNLATGRTPLDKNAKSILSALLETQKPDEGIRLILNAAIKSGDPEIRCRLLWEEGIVGFVLLNKILGDTRECTPNLEKNRDLWRTLILDRSTVNRGSLSKTTVCSVGDIAADATLLCYYPKSDDIYSDIDPKLLGQERALNLKRRFALALLDAKIAVPATPSADTVSAVRRQEIVDALKRKPVDDLPAYLDGLSDDETLAIQESLEKDKALKARLTPLRVKVDRVYVPKAFEPAFAPLKALAGKTFAKSDAKKIFALLDASTNGERLTLINVSRESPFAGVTIHVADTRAIASFERLSPEVTKNDGPRYAIVGVETKTPPAIWLREKKSATRAELEAESIAEFPREKLAEKQKKFWKAVEAALSEANAENDLGVGFFVAPMGFARMLEEEAETVGERPANNDD